MPTTRTCTTLLFAFSLTALLRGQEPPPALANADRTLLLQRLQRFDVRSTDWTMLIDVGDKVQELGIAAVPVLDAEIAKAKEREDKRYALRLLGVLTRIDPRGAQQLAEFVRGDDTQIAAIAARVLGRCGAKAEQVREPLLTLLRAEQRDPVAPALAMAVADADVREAAPILRERLATADAKAAKWLSIAYGVLCDEPPQQLREWIATKGPFTAAAALAARRHHDAELTQVLLKALTDRSDKTTWAWVVHALGASRDEAAREALTASLAGDSGEDEAGPNGERRIASSSIDPRKLALLRLGDETALQWALEIIDSNGTRKIGQMTVQMLGVEVVRLPALAGKWESLSAASLLAITKKADRDYGLRIHAARGLCWRRDPRGLVALADLLTEPGAADALHVDDAQRTLQEFVADADRPDHLPSSMMARMEGPRREVGLDAQPASIGKQWQQWLANKRGRVTWRQPPLDTEDDELLQWQ